MADNVEAFGARCQTLKDDDIARYRNPQIARWKQTSLERPDSDARGPRFGSYCFLLPQRCQRTLPYGAYLPYMAVNAVLLEQWGTQTCGVRVTVRARRLCDPRTHAP